MHVGAVLPIDRHGVANSVETDIHVRVEEGLELRADEESLAGSILEHLLPNDLLFADSGQGLVLGSVEMLCFLRPIAVSERIHTSIEFRLILTPIVGPANVLIFALDSSVFAIPIEWFRFRIMSPRFTQISEEGEVVSETCNHSRSNIVSYDI